MHIKKKEKKERIPYLKSVIPTNYPDAEDMLIIIEKFQSFSACGGRKPWPNIYFSKTPNLKISQHNTPADERLVLLWLIKSSHQWPNLLESKKYFRNDYVNQEKTSEGNSLTIKFQRE